MRKCLYLSYYFPPSGGSGVQRTLKMARYLPAAGWTPTVVTVDPNYAAYPSRDTSLLADVPESLDVSRTRAWDPYAAYGRLLGTGKNSVVSIGFIGEGRPGLRQRLARFLRANVFIPDARIGWYPYARAELARMLRTGAYEAIISTGPPHSTHLAARGVARRTATPWIVDLRDPWTEIYFNDAMRSMAPARALDRMLERRVLRDASALVVVSESMKKRLEERGVKTPIRCIPNGFDPRDFAGKAPRVKANVIRHVGSLGPMQSVHALASALAKLESNQKPFYELSFVGSTDPVAIESVAKSPLTERVSVEGVVDHVVAVERMREAGILLLVIPNAHGAASIVTGKLPEYIATGRPVLGIGPVNGDAAGILRETGAGQMFDWSDAKGIKGFLESHALQVTKGLLPVGAAATALVALARPTQACMLAELLTIVVDGGGP